MHADLLYISRIEAARRREHRVVRARLDQYAVR
jgi:hypothetical protein